MTLRQKLVIAFATVAVVVAALVGGFTYGLTAHNLRIEVVDHWPPRRPRCQRRGPCRW